MRLAAIVALGALTLFLGGNPRSEAADASARFVGRVAVEWLDDDPFITRMRLLQPFAYQDARGKQWGAPEGAILDGRSLPVAFLDLIGPAFAGDYRRSSVVYDAQVKAMTEPWRAVHRMFYEASTTEGVPEMDAKLMYALLYSGGLRWETRDSSCFRTCHARLESLSWRPMAEAQEIEAVTQWIRKNDPDLDRIDRKLDEAISKPGPHIFSQGYSRPILPEPAPVIEQKE
jgi:hypothetical protein